MLDILNVPLAACQAVAKELQTMIMSAFLEQDNYPVSIVDVCEVEEQFIPEIWTYANCLHTLLQVNSTSSMFAAETWPGWIYWADLMTLFELKFHNCFNYCHLCCHLQQSLDLYHESGQCEYT